MGPNRYFFTTNRMHVHNPRLFLFGGEKVRDILMQEKEEFDRKEPLKARLQDMVVSLFTSLLSINHKLLP